MKREKICWGRKIEGIVLVLFFLFESVVYSQGIHKIPLYLNDKEILIEVAKTREEMAQGLMGRKHLGNSEGMLFIFEREGYHGFWMKNTFIPLSIAFIDKEGRILGINNMEPLTLEPHIPPGPILYALEMKQGWFFFNSIKVGNFIRFSK